MFLGISDQYAGSHEILHQSCHFPTAFKFRHFPGEIYEYEMDIFTNSQFLVNKICPKHLKVDTKHPMHVLQALPGNGTQKENTAIQPTF